MQAINLQLVPDFLQYAEFRLTQVPVGCRDITGMGISGFMQRLRQGIKHQPEQRIKPVFLFQKVIDDL